jgi:hypothetical protein
MHVWASFEVHHPLHSIRGSSGSSWTILISRSDVHLPPSANPREKQRHEEPQRFPGPNLGRQLIPLESIGRLDVQVNVIGVEARTAAFRHEQDWDNTPLSRSRTGGLLPENLGCVLRVYTTREHASIQTRARRVLVRPAPLLVRGASHD